MTQSVSEVCKALRDHAMQMSAGQGHVAMQTTQWIAADLLEAQSAVVNIAREYLNLGGIKLASKLEDALRALSEKRDE